MTHSHDVSLDRDYSQWLTELVGRYRQSQVKAAVKVNSERLLFNWQLGRDLVVRKAEERWGSGVVEQVSLDLQAAFPKAEGFSASTLWYSKRWYLFYAEKLQRPVEESQTVDGMKDKILQRVVEELPPSSRLEQIGHRLVETNTNGVGFPEIFGYVPWGQHIEIISRCKTLDEAAFYLKQVVSDGLSRPALVRIIKADLYHKQGGAVSNFTNILPNIQAQLAQEITKENYDFGFITLPKSYSEKQLEDALSDQLTRFLLELGTGFAFMGRQKEIVVAGTSRRIDMLFYHIRLRCYIVCELKAVPFEPEFTGKLNYYVNAVNNLLKTDGDNPTIGLLICSDMNKTDVQWAFEGIATPLGVATYDNVQIEEIKKQLPTVEQLTREMEEVKRNNKTARKE